MTTTTVGTSIDRRQLIQEQSAINGVDYVEVVRPPEGQPAVQLRLTFVNSLPNLPAATEIRVDGGVRIPSIDIISVDPTEDSDTVLLTLAGTGDLSTYTVQLVTSKTDPSPPVWVDPVLCRACFTFGLDCLTDLACDDEPDCPPATPAEPRLDYLARDWESFRAVLLDRISLLQPDWKQRNPADVRMALVELLAELGDRASYRQDAIATEAYLGTARRRISARRHARLVDYSMSDGTNARTWVQFSVLPDVPITAGDSMPALPKGTRLLTGTSDTPVLIAPGSDADVAARRAGALEFQTMEEVRVVARHSTIRFYSWSGSRPAIPTGATAATLAGHLPQLTPGQVLILMENRDPAGPRRSVADADPSRRQAVRLIGVTAFVGANPLRDRLTGELITEINWHAGDALGFPLAIEHEVSTEGGGAQTLIDGALALGNVVLADHGESQAPATFGPVPVEGKVTYRLPRGPLSQIPLQRVKRSLADNSGEGDELVPFDPKACAGAALTASPALVLPDVDLRETNQAGPSWDVRSDLISSGSNRDVVIEVDDEGSGWMRFGGPDDGVMRNGLRPRAGTVLHATYRTGNGTIGNVGVGAVRAVIDDPNSLDPMLRAVLKQPGAVKVWNPLPAQGGTEPETIEHVRQRAPFAFRRQERAVTADDYAARAGMFDQPGWPRIQQAVATIRWTGSWYIVVVAVDPVGIEDADEEYLAAVTDYLDRYRMAGHDLQVVPANYAPLEVGLAVRVDPQYRRDLVRGELLDLMSNRRLPHGALGLFHPDRLTFGTSVYLGPIIAAAQTIPGMATVEVTRFSRYRLPGTDARVSGRIDIGPREIARLDNDPSQPERGRFFLDMVEGGR